MTPISFEFGDWLPDNPPLINPAFPTQTEAYFSGGKVPLSTASNIVYQDGAYRPFLPLSTSNALASACLGAVSCYDTTGAIQLFAGTATKLYKLVSGTWTDYSAAGGYTATHWEFAVYGDKLVATDGTDAMQVIGITSGTKFAVLDSSGSDLVPIPQTLGIVRDFLVAGNTYDSTNGYLPSNVQWSALANIASWPVPYTESAYANQAGSQLLYQDYGSVVGIGDNEGFGLLFQQAGITRMTYVGGAQVFDFQTIDKIHGCVGRKAFCRVGNNYFFMSKSGLCGTDGSSVEELGVDKFNKYFRDNVNQSYIQLTQVIPDVQHQCIYIAFQEGSSNLDTLLCFNYADGKVTLCTQNAEMYFPYLSGNEYIPGGFDTSHAYGTFSGSASAATITTQDFQLNPAGRALVSAVRPLVEGTATVAIGTRSALGSSTSLTSYGSIDTRTQRAPFRAEGMFHRVSVQTSGSFTDAIGFTVWMSPSGSF